MRCAEEAAVAASPITIYESAPFQDLPGGVIRPGGLAATKRLVGGCGFKRGSAILDLGCGMGTTVACLREQFALDAYGVDISERLLELGATKHPGAPLIEASAKDLPFESEVFDGIIAECSLSVVDQTDVVLQEVRRTLKNGGLFLISDVYLKTPPTEDAEDRPRKGCFAHAMTKEDLADALDAAGFTILRWEDRSEWLRGYVAMVMMRTGQLPAIWEAYSRDPATTCGTSSARKRTRPGYFQLVAKKECF